MQQASHPELGNALLMLATGTEAFGTDRNIQNIIHNLIQTMHKVKTRVRFGKPRSLGDSVASELTEMQALTV